MGRAKKDMAHSAMTLYANKGVFYPNMTRISQNQEFYLIREANSPAEVILKQAYILCK